MLMAELLTCLSIATAGSLAAVLAEYAAESFLNMALALLRPLGIAKRIMPDANVKVWPHEFVLFLNCTFCYCLLSLRRCVNNLSRISLRTHRFKASSYRACGPWLARISLCSSKSPSSGIG